MRKQHRIIRMLIMLFSAAVAFLICTACGRREVPAITTNWEPGLYTVALETGEETPTFGVVRLLESTDAGAEVKVYGNLYKDRPGNLSKRALKYRPSSSVPGWGGVKVVINYSIFTSMRPELVN